LIIENWWYYHSPKSIHKRKFEETLEAIRYMPDCSIIFHISKLHFENSKLSFEK
jgi:hypothetical protein